MIEEQKVRIKRISKPVRLEITKYDLLSYYAKRDHKSRSKILDKIFYVYEKNDGVLKG